MSALTKKSILQISFKKLHNSDVPKTNLVCSVRRKTSLAFIGHPLYFFFTLANKGSNHVSLRRV